MALEPRGKTYVIIIACSILDLTSALAQGLLLPLLQTQKMIKHLLMTLCWLKLYKTEHFMSGRWGYGEEVCSDTVKQIASRLQHLKSKKIQFGPFDSKRTYLGTVNCVHCETNEFRMDPNSKWYSHKHNGASVV